jgi:CheY-like chemotaxis protein
MAAGIGMLLVDDDADVREAMVNWLYYLGFDLVAQASSGEEALETFRAEDHHLVVTDYQLGRGIDGLDLARELRKREPTLPIAILSGAPPDVDPEVALVFIKPIKMDLFEGWLAGSMSDAQIHYRPRR